MYKLWTMVRVLMFKAFWRALSKEVTKNHPCLNEGGCGVFAAKAGLLLSKFFPVRVRVLSRTKGSIRGARRHLKQNTVMGWDDFGVDINHLILEVVVCGIPLLLDSEGFNPHTRRNMANHYLLEDSLSLRETLEMANCPEGWNATFWREQIPALESLLENWLSSEKLAKLQQPSFTGWGRLTAKRWNSRLQAF